MTLDDLEQPIRTLVEKMRFTEPTRNKIAVVRSAKIGVRVGLLYPN